MSVNSIKIRLSTPLGEGDRFEILTDAFDACFKAGIITTTTSLNVLKKYFQNYEVVLANNSFYIFIDNRPVLLCSIELLQRFLNIYTQRLKTKYHSVEVGAFNSIFQYSLNTYWYDPNELSSDDAKILAKSLTFKNYIQTFPLNPETFAKTSEQFSRYMLKEFRSFDDFCDYLETYSSEIDNAPDYLNFLAQQSTPTYSWKKPLIGMGVFVLFLLIYFLTKAFS